MRRRVNSGESPRRNMCLRCIRSYPMIREQGTYTVCCFFFSSRRRHTRCSRDWSSDVCSSDLRDQNGKGSQPGNLECGRNCYRSSSLIYSRCPLRRHGSDRNSDGPTFSRTLPRFGVVRDNAEILGKRISVYAHSQPGCHCRGGSRSSRTLQSLPTLALSPQSRDKCG